MKLGSLKDLNVESGDPSSTLRQLVKESYRGAQAVKTAVAFLVSNFNQTEKQARKILGVIQKENPYHDPETGRFTTAEGAGGSAKVVQPADLKGTGWYLEEHHESWVASGASRLVEVPVSSIEEYKPEYQYGLPTDSDKRVSGMRDTIRTGYSLPVVSGWKIKGEDKYQLVDGHHRLAAARAEGRSRIPMLLNREDAARAETRTTLSVKL